MKIRAQKPLLGILAAVALTAALISCASLFHMAEKPKITLDHVDLKDASFLGATLLFVLKVENPNSADLKVNEVNYHVFLDGKPLAESRTEQPVTIPAKSQALVSLPLPIEFQKLWSGLSGLLMEKTVAYKIEGEAKLPLFTIPFTNEGTLDPKTLLHQ